MLVLTRKQHETIHIGQDVVIKVISAGRGKVKIGIEAPSSVRVLRGELSPHAVTQPSFDDDAIPVTSTLVARHPVL